MDSIIDKIKTFFEIYAIFDVPNFIYWRDDKYKEWLQNNCQADMRYMERANRGEINRVFDSAKSVIVVGKYYGNKQREEGRALFAIGEDYHSQIKRELNEVLSVIKSVFPNVKGRAVVDTAPIFEKALANYGGLGWIGRNSLLINDKYGSYLNLGVLMVDVDLEEVKNTINGSCEGCRACVDACKMSAIRNDFMIDARNCISYLTFYNKVSEPMHGWHYCCDDCQIVCPYNKL